MKTDQAISHFGSYAALARALGVDQSAIRHWKGEVPLLRQYQLQVITAGKLVATAPERREVAA